jgi:hypothetical protein
MLRSLFFSACLAILFFKFGWCFFSICVFLFCNMLQIIYLKLVIKFNGEIIISLHYGDSQDAENFSLTIPEGCSFHPTPITDVLMIQKKDTLPSVFSLLDFFIACTDIWIKSERDIQLHEFHSWSSSYHGDLLTVPSPGRGVVGSLFTS